MNAMNARKQTEGKRAGAALLALPLMLLMALPAYAQSEDDAAFEYEERSTIDTIPFRSVAEEELANTVIEGGLAAPAAGVPVQQATDDDFYLDPLALQDPWAAAKGMKGNRYPPSDGYIGQPCGSFTDPWAAWAGTGSSAPWS